MPEVDAAVDAVGFEARGHGADGEHEAPATVLNSIMDVTRVGGKLGIPGLYVTGDPGGVDDARQGRLAVDPDRPRLGEVAPLHHRPVSGDELPPRSDADDPERSRAHREGRQRDDHHLDDAPDGYKDFDQGAAKKFVLNPNDLIKAA